MRRYYIASCNFTALLAGWLLGGPVGLAPWSAPSAKAS